MLRKYTALVLICISGIIYAGHSFIPHLHHAEYSESGVQVITDGHGDHDYDDSDHHGTGKKQHHKSDEPSGIFDILAHFSHGEPLYKSDKGTEIKVDANQKIPVLTCKPIVIKSEERIFISPQKVSFHYTDPDYHSLLHVPFGLRAPPVAA